MRLLAALGVGRWQRARIRLLRALGRRVALDVGEDGKTALARRAGAFLRAGGSLSLADWYALEDIERDAFVEAHDAIDAERCAAIGYATFGPQQAAEVLEPADGGVARRGIAMESIIGKVAERLRREVIQP